MARPYGSDWGRWPDDRQRWSEGEEIGSSPRGERDPDRPESYAGTRDMDFGGGYGGGEDRGGGRRGRYLAGTRDLDEGWSRSPSWERDRAGSRGGGSSGEGRLGGESRQGGMRDESWRDRGGMTSSDRDRWTGERDRWSGERQRGSEEGERWSRQDQGRGGGYRGGWGGTGEYGSSTGGYGASGLTGSTGPWGRGGAGYSGSGQYGGGAGFGGGGSYGGGRYGRGGEESYGASYGELGRTGWRGDWRSQERDRGEYRGGEHWRARDDDRGFMERMGDTFREGMAKLTGRGPKGYRRSDDRVREDVCERIARSDLNAENVEVHVENGEVTLSGEVESRTDKRRLEDLIDDVFGVDEVHNHLRLRRESASTETSRDRGAGQTSSDDAGLPH